MTKDIEAAVDPQHHKFSLQIPAERVQEYIDPSTGNLVLQYMDVCEFTMTEEQFLGHLMGQELKYILRLGKKDPPLQEAMKTNWYTGRKVRFLKWLQQKQQG